METIKKEKALEIAAQDAATAYMNLTAYEIEAELKDTLWVITYKAGPTMGRAGGPYYEISSTSGEILNKVYYQ